MEALLWSVGWLLLLKLLLRPGDTDSRERGYSMMMQHTVRARKRETGDATVVDERRRSCGDADSTTPHAAQMVLLLPMMQTSPTHTHPSIVLHTPTHTGRRGNTHRRFASLASVRLSAAQQPGQNYLKSGCTTRGQQNSQHMYTARAHHPSSLTPWLLCAGLCAEHTAVRVHQPTDTCRHMPPSSSLCRGAILLCTQVLVNHVCLEPLERELHVLPRC
jgi:hypothetical protein